MVGLLFLSLASLGQALEVGDAVWAQWRPNDWYPGTLTEETSLGFVVAFSDVTGVEDVAEDLPVSAEILMPLIVIDRAPDAGQVKIGTRVLAEWPEDRWYYPATIVTASEEGLYDIQFDDGDVGTVDLSQLRLRSEPSQPAIAPAVGDVVWAQWEPGDWYPGTLTDKSDIGFHVVYDDESEQDLPPSLIVVVHAVGAGQVQVGTRVLAQWTDERFYPGTVLSVAEDGGYDVLLDEGERGLVELTGLLLFGE